jgi:hypothetical protein
MKTVALPVHSQAEWTDGKEGMFILPDKVYRDAIGVSQSDLKLAIDDADLIRQRKVRPMAPSRNMELGTLVHAGILEPHTYGDGISHVVQPEFYPDGKTAELKPWSNAANYCKAWAKEQEGKLIISQEEWRAVERMIEAFTTHPEGKFMLKHGYREVAVFNRDPETGLMWKGKLDLILAAPKKIRICDIKTTGRGDADSFGETSADFGYHIQSAFYRELVARAISRETGETKYDVWDRTEFIHATLETGGSQFLRWLAFDHTALSIGDREYEAALARIVMAMNTGRWSRVQQVSLPKWKLQKTM